MMTKSMGKALIFSAPSGSGKTTLVRQMMREFPELEFSVSATTRSPRVGEVNGKDYHFLDKDSFRIMIDTEGFVEWEEVYVNGFYGTLKSEVERIWKKNHVVIFDVDVKGGRNLKKYFGDHALSVFVRAPSLEELENRLRSRGTEAEDDIRTRLEKSSFEMGFEKYFDVTVINDSLSEALEDCRSVIRGFIHNHR